MKDQLTNIISNEKVPFLLVFFLIVIFVVSYAQDPLYTSNQNTYLLHGLANAGLGFLSNDWMANTVDPFPVFSFLISLTYSTAPIFFFYIYYSVILGVFLCSIMGIASNVWGVDRSYREYLAFFVIVAGICSAALSFLSERLIGIDLSNLMHGGVAGQYILGPVFQPSVFGVFLLMSIYSFLRNKVFVAVLLLGVSANLHASYLLGAATLTISYIAIIIKEEKNYRKAAFVGSLSLVAVMPTVYYSYLAFSPTSSEVMRQANDILVNYRNPHHAKLDMWFDSGTLFQILIVILALLVHRNNRIFLVILIPFVISISLTIIQLLTGSNVLALLFPWRISVFLVPLSTFMLVAAIVSYIFRKYEQQIYSNKNTVNMLIAAIIGLLFISGAFMSFLKDKSHKAADFLSMMSFVAGAKTKYDVYLIPTDMYRFRLQAGASIFVDRKSHPYKDSEVMGWYNRLQIADKFFSESAESHCETLQDLSLKYQITHVVYDSKENFPNCSSLVKVYNDEIYSVYNIMR